MDNEYIDCCCINGWTDQWINKSGSSDDAMVG